MFSNYIEISFRLNYIIPVIKKIPFPGSSVVEHLAVNERVVGSKPTPGAKLLFMA